MDPFDANSTSFKVLFASPPNQQVAAALLEVYHYDLACFRLEPESSMNHNLSNLFSSERYNIVNLQTTNMTVATHTERDFHLISDSTTGIWLTTEAWKEGEVFLFGLNPSPGNSPTAPTALYTSPIEAIVTLSVNQSKTIFGVQEVENGDFGVIGSSLVNGAIKIPFHNENFILMAHNAPTVIHPATQ